MHNCPFLQKPCCICFMTACWYGCVYIYIHIYIQMYRFQVGHKLIRGTNPDIDRLPRFRSHVARPQYPWIIEYWLQPKSTLRIGNPALGMDETLWTKPANWCLCILSIDGCFKTKRGSVGVDFTARSSSPRSYHRGPAESRSLDPLPAKRTPDPM